VHDITKRHFKSSQRSVDTGVYDACLSCSVKDLYPDDKEMTKSMIRFLLFVDAGKFLYEPNAGEDKCKHCRGPMPLGWNAS
jgi:hypothetical protein